VQLVKQKDTQTLSFLAKLDALRLLKGWTWEQTAKAVGLSRSMLHNLRTGRNKVSDKVLYRLEQTEKSEGLKGTSRPSKAKELIEALFEQAKVSVTPEDQDRGYVMVKLEYLRGEPPKGFPCEIKVARPPHATRGQVVADAMAEDYDKVLMACLRKEYATDDFLGLLTPFTLAALKDAAMSLVFGIRWRERISS
jgi:transcriptional regulator with XRE-family HTH domain